MADILPHDYIPQSELFLPKFAAAHSALMQWAHDNDFRVGEDDGPEIFYIVEQHTEGIACCVQLFADDNYDTPKYIVHMCEDYVTPPHKMNDFNAFVAEDVSIFSMCDGIMICLVCGQVHQSYYRFDNCKHCRGG